MTTETAQDRNDGNAIADAMIAQDSGIDWEATRTAADVDACDAMETWDVETEDETEPTEQELRQWAYGAAALALRIERENGKDAGPRSRKLVDLSCRWTSAANALSIARGRAQRGAVHVSTTVAILGATVGAVGIYWTLRLIAVSLGIAC
jgi:hypothetical protein